MVVSNEWVAVIVSLVGLALAVAGIIGKQATRLAKLEVKVDTMWHFNLRRGLAEGMEQGVVYRNSPLKVTETARNWMASLTVDLHDFYRETGRYMKDTDLAEAIERRFGERLLHEVCLPRHIYMGACLILAMEIAREAPA